MNYIVLVGSIIFIAILVIYRIIINKRTIMKNLLYKFGEKHYEYDVAERMDKISFLHDLKNKRIENSDLVRYTIDNITWNDLDMDEVYSRISSNTMSNIGEEYLYDMLHSIETNNETLDKRNELITFFDNNEKIRVQIQYLYRKFHKLYGYSAYQCIDESKHIKRNALWPHVVMCIAFFVSLFTMIISIKVGGILVGVVSIHNIFKYYVTKQYIPDEGYISFRYLAKMLRLSNKICKVNAEELKPYQGDLLSARDKFRIISRYSIFLHVGVGFISDVYDLLLDYIRILTHIDIIALYYMVNIVEKETELLNKFCDIIGLFDASIAVAAYRRQLPYYSIPNLSHNKEIKITIKELYHPLLNNPVTNSIHIQKGMLITGSNASGKSTFIKSIAVNAILSQTIFTSLAKEYAANYFKVLTSMALKDSIETNESYYIVEIKAIKRILDQIDESIPTLCCIDEVLRGTNTIERIAASSQILKEIESNNALCIAATHDIELTYLLEDEYVNYHFTENVTEQGLIFPYILYSGRTTTKNAIKLLEILNYPKRVLDNARELAGGFEAYGKWSS